MVTAVIMVFSSQLLLNAARIPVFSWLLHVERKTLLLRTAWINGTKMKNSRINVKKNIWTNVVNSEELVSLGNTTNKRIYKLEKCMYSQYNPLVTKLVKTVI